ncbi:hypothetical protein C6P52_04040 [Enterococcus mundtii]|nr:hypothetical protein C6P52_04040 [Enterococcus mundtii]PTO45257.1 hypothetical protein C6P54_00915 [Enterococcus mundtii]
MVIQKCTIHIYSDHFDCHSITTFQKKVYLLGRVPSQEKRRKIPSLRFEKSQKCQEYPNLPFPE